MCVSTGNLQNTLTIIAARCSHPHPLTMYCTLWSRCRTITSETLRGLHRWRLAGINRCQAVLLQLFLLFLLLLLCLHQQLTSGSCPLRFLLPGSIASESNLSPSQRWLHRSASRTLRYSMPVRSRDRSEGLRCYIVVGYSACR